MADSASNPSTASSKTVEVSLPMAAPPGPIGMSADLQLDHVQRSSRYTVPIYRGDTSARHASPLRNLIECVLRSPAPRCSWCVWVALGVRALLVLERGVGAGGVSIVRGGPAPGAAALMGRGGAVGAWPRCAARRR